MIRDSDTQQLVGSRRNNCHEAREDNIHACHVHARDLEVEVEVLDLLPDIQTRGDHIFLFIIVNVPGVSVLALGCKGLSDHLACICAEMMRVLPMFQKLSYFAYMHMKLLFT